MKNCINTKCVSGKPSYARGYCTRCYTRWKKHGDPNVVMKRGVKPTGNSKSRYISVWDKEIGNNVLLHRRIMEEILGRKLLPTETVHHKNGNTFDNRPDNLELWSKTQPSGQRVQDKIEYALEILTLYASELLAPRKDGKNV